MTQGTIRSIQIALGLGFVRPANGTTDLLFHRAALEAGEFEELREGMAVTFEAVPDPRNPAHQYAQHLRRVTN